MTFLNGIMTLAKQVSNETIRNINNNPDKTYFPFFGDSENIFNSGISIDRVFVTIPGVDFKIYWYGFLIAVGLVLALVYAYKRMVSCGLEPDKISDAIIAGLIGAIFGARLYYIVFNDIGLGFKDFFNTRNGGLAIYGGIIGAIIVGGAVVKLRKQRLMTALDLAGPCFLIGQCVGRWGNFFNQEAFGTNTTLPWGMMSKTTINYLSGITDDYAAKTGEALNAFLPVHPCFLYESLWCFIGFLLLHFYFKHRKFDGEIFLMYVGWYGLGRFFIEGLRTDSLYLMNMRISQLVAGICVVAAVILIIALRIKVKRSGGSELFYQTEDSIVQLAAYRLDIERTKEKKDLKKRISQAKDEGKDFSELQKEYDDKFGEEGMLAHKKEINRLREEERAYFESRKKAEDISPEDDKLSDDKDNDEEE